MRAENGGGRHAGERRAAFRPAEREQRKTAADAIRASGGRHTRERRAASRPAEREQRAGRQFFLLLGRKKSAARKANTTAAVMPALAAESAPVNAPNSPLSAPRMAPRASR